MKRSILKQIAKRVNQIIAIYKSGIDDMKYLRSICANET